MTDHEENEHWLKYALGQFRRRPLTALLLCCVASTLSIDMNTMIGDGMRENAVKNALPEALANGSLRVMVDYHGNIVPLAQFMRSKDRPDQLTLQIQDREGNGFCTIMMPSDAMEKIYTKSQVNPEALVSAPNDHDVAEICDLSKKEVASIKSHFTYQQNLTAYGDLNARSNPYYQVREANVISRITTAPAHQK